MGAIGGLFGLIAGQAGTVSDVADPEPTAHLITPASISSAPPELPPHIASVSTEPPQLKTDSFFERIPYSVHGEDIDCFYHEAEDAQSTMVYIAGTQSSILDFASEFQRYSAAGVSIIGINYPDRDSDRDVITKNYRIYYDAIFNPDSPINSVIDPELPKVLTLHSASSLYNKVITRSRPELRGFLNANFSYIVNLAPFLDTSDASLLSEPIKRAIGKYYFGLNPDAYLGDGDLEKAFKALQEIGFTVSWKRLLEAGEQLFKEATHGSFAGLTRGQALDAMAWAEMVREVIFDTPFDPDHTSPAQVIYICKDDPAACAETASEYGKKYGIPTIVLEGKEHHPFWKRSELHTDLLKLFAALPKKPSIQTDDPYQRWRRGPQQLDNRPIEPTAPRDYFCDIAGSMLLPERGPTLDSQSAAQRHGLTEPPATDYVLES